MIVKKFANINLYNVRLEHKIYYLNNNSYYSSIILYYLVLQPENMKNYFLQTFIT